MCLRKNLKLHSLNLQSLDAATSLDLRALGGLWTQAGYQQEIERETSICLGISNSKADLLAMGFMWVILDEAHLISIAVDPDWRRNGLGKLLVIKLLLNAVQQSCERATLEVKASNQGAIGLYQHLKFQALGTRPDYYGKGEDAVIYWLNQLQQAQTQQFLHQSLKLCQLRLLARHLKLELG